MLVSGLRNWFGRGTAAIPSAVTVPVELPSEPGATNLDPPAPNAPTGWTNERLAVNDALWGAGYVFPGGEIETLRMAKPLGLSAASSLLLLGAGAGGPACSLAKKFGAWITGYNANAELVVAATERGMQASLGRRVQFEQWDPNEPDFPANFYHHAMVLEAMGGARPEPLLASTSRALKPGGHVAMIELVADVPLDPADPVVAAWVRLEQRTAAALPTELAITRTLGRQGFDVRIVEDLSARHAQQALIGWRRTVRELEQKKPSARHAAQIVGEAELWLLRLRLVRDGRVRLLRWHAIRR